MNQNQSSICVVCDENIACIDDYLGKHHNINVIKLAGRQINQNTLDKYRPDALFIRSVSQINSKIFNRLHQLKFVGSATIGTDHVDKDFLQKNKGEILNVASIASFFPGPIMATYYASKAFVFSFTEAIREEVAYSNIKIGTLCPGPTATEFEKSPNMEKSTMFAKLKIMTAKKVAQITYRDFEKGKNIIIPGTLNKITVFIARFLPRKTITKIAKRMQEKK